MGKPIRTRTTAIQPQGHLSAPGQFSWLKTFLLLLCLISQFGLETQTTHGQSTGTIAVQPPQLEAFPLVTIDFKLTDPADVNDNLSIDDVMLLENNQEVIPLTLRQVHQGTHFTLVINGNRDFDLRDVDGVSPYQKITAELSKWAMLRKFAKSDTWSFINHQGMAVRNTSSAEGWTTALDAYQPNFRTLQPNPGGLETAIQMAKEWIVPFGVDKSILYITPPADSAHIEQIRNLAQIAGSAGIQVNVWMIGDAYFLTNDQGRVLMDLASTTQGIFFHYTGEESLPNPEDILSPLGKYYTLSYESEIRETGTYPLTLQITTADRSFTGEIAPFYIYLAPPKPILVSPPTSIIRSAPLNVVNPQEAMAPKKVNINIIIEFPDGYTRDIAASRLYVDDLLEDERFEPPFEDLTWDLSSILDSGEHKIQVEVDDTLGLSSRTIELIVPVIVESPDPEPSFSPSRQQVGLWLSGGILFAAAAILFAWAVRQFIDSPAFANLSHAIFSRFKRPTRLFSPSSALPNNGQLIPLNTFVDPSQTDSLINLIGNPSIIGSHAQKANVVVQGNEINPVHAQIHVRNDHFYIQDMGTDSGTWVNYDRVDAKPVELHSGDIIHFGNTGFRFTISINLETLFVDIQKFEPGL
jgi:hypothetical protein